MSDASENMLNGELRLVLSTVSVPAGVQSRQVRMDELPNWAFKSSTVLGTAEFYGLNLIFDARKVVVLGLHGGMLRNAITQMLFSDLIFFANRYPLFKSKHLQYRLRHSAARECLDPGSSRQFVVRRFHEPP